MDVDPALHKLRHAIEPGVTPLIGVDMVASFVRLPVFSFFENVGREADFMPSKLLRDSLYETLVRFPLLVGRFRVESGGFLSVVVDRDNLNLPVFQDVECDVHFDELRAATFSPKLLPDWDIAASALAVGPCVGEIKLAQVLVARLQGNSGVVLFSSAAHAVMDGLGNCMLLKTWADTCRRMASGEPDSSSELPTAPIVHDRNILWQKIPRQLSPLDHLVRHVHVPGTMLSRWLAWLSPETRGKMIRGVNTLVATSGNSYYISRKSLDVLRDAILRVVPGKRRISHNDLMVALVTVVMAQCAEAPHKKKKSKNKGSWLCLPRTQPRSFQTSIATDMRPRIPGLVEAGYSGNGMIKQLFSTSYEELQQPVTLGLLAEVAALARSSTDAVDSEYIQQFADSVQNSRDCYIRPIVCGPRHPMKVLTTNHTRLSYYANDFGYGAPAWVCPPEGLFPNFILFFPAPHTMDGYTIFINAPTDILNRVRLHDYWSSMTSFLN
ncbi:hypothetical protein H4R19_005938 [Coemansia spiralis]|nr:hypothetical protein H4R19_005938 [Coemansia spiralis]